MSVFSNACINKVYYTNGSTSPVDLRCNLFELNKLYKDPKFVEKIQEQARSVGCLMDRGWCVHQPQGGYTLSDKVQTLANRFLKTSPTKIPYGEKEPFYNELSCGDGTCFLIGKRLVLTAAHCLFKEDKAVLDLEYLKEKCVVFGLQMESETQYKNISEEDVYNIDHVIAFRYERQNGLFEDWAIVQLTEEVKNHSPLDVNFCDPVKIDDPVYVLGHPEGLPMKYVRDGVVVITGEIPNQFQIKAHTFNGNSGSPVFNFATQRVVGMLISGNPDYALDRNYYGTNEERMRIHSIDNASSKSFEMCQEATSLSFLKAVLPSIDLHMIDNRKTDLRAPGLNLEVQCTNTECADRNRIVIMPCHFGTFDLAWLCSERKCITCGAKIKYDNINTLVLRSCTYEINAINYDYQPVPYSSSLLPGKEFRFDMQTWRYLEITVSDNGPLDINEKKRRSECVIA